jgi:hypothetical protein
VIKRITFVRQAPDDDGADFRTGWRQDTKNRLAAMPANARPRRVDHCVVRGGRKDAWCDGVMLEWFDTTAAVDANREWCDAARAMHGSPSDDGPPQSVVVDERCVFGDQWLRQSAAAGGIGGVPLLIGFIQRIEQSTRPEFRDYWWTRHRPLANRLVPPELQPLAYVHNYVVEPTSFRFDGIGEMYERSLDTARARGAWFDSAAAAPLIADEEQFLRRDTREVLVTDHEIVANA